MAVAIRDRIKEKAQPLLEPGEQIQAVIPSQTRNGWLGALGIVWLIFTTATGRSWLPIVASPSPTPASMQWPSRRQLSPRCRGTLRSVLHRGSGGRAQASVKPCSSTGDSTKTSS